MTFALSFSCSFIPALVRFVALLSADKAVDALLPFDPGNLFLVKEALAVAAECLRVPFEVSEKLLECRLSGIE